MYLLSLTCVFSAQPRQSQSPKQEPEVSPHSIDVDVDLVLATVTVTDRNGRYVTGLEKENFKLAEDKVPQEISYFSSEDIPLSVGIILDVSGSMKDKLKTAVEAAITFMKGGSPDDEYFLVEFPTSQPKPQNSRMISPRSRACSWLPGPKAGPPFSTRSIWDSQSSNRETTQSEPFC